MKFKTMIGKIKDAMRELKDTVLEIYQQIKRHKGGQQKLGRLEK